MAYLPIFKRRTHEAKPTIAPVIRSSYVNKSDASYAATSDMNVRMFSQLLRPEYWINSSPDSRYLTDMTTS